MLTMAASGKYAGVSDSDYFYASPTLMKLVPMDKKTKAQYG